jgi:hypothetical protein
VWHHVTMILWWGGIKPSQMGNTSHSIKQGKASNTCSRSDRYTTHGQYSKTKKRTNGTRRLIPRKRTKGTAGRVVGGSGGDASLWPIISDGTFQPADEGAGLERVGH